MFSRTQNNGFILIILSSSRFSLYLDMSLQQFTARLLGYTRVTLSIDCRQPPTPFSSSRILFRIWRQTMYVCELIKKISCPSASYQIQIRHLRVCAYVVTSQPDLHAVVEMLKPCEASKHHFETSNFPVWFSQFSRLGSWADFFDHY